MSPRVLFQFYKFEIFLSHFLDVNECDYDNGGCESICINQPGSFKCDCEKGFQIDTVGRTKCLGKWKCDIWLIALFEEIKNNS